MELVGGELYERIVVKQGTLYHFEDYHDITNILPVSTLEVFHIDEAKRTLIAYSGEKECVFLVEVCIEYNVKRVVTHTESTVYEKTYIEITDALLGVVEMNFKTPKKLATKSDDILTTEINKGTSILLEYNEYPLGMYTFISEQGDSVTCKAFRLNRSQSIHTVHDFASAFNSYVSDDSIDFVHTKIIQH